MRVVRKLPNVIKIVRYSGLENFSGKVWEFVKNKSGKIGKCREEYVKILCINNPAPVTVTCLICNYF